MKQGLQRSLFVVNHHNKIRMTEENLNVTNFVGPSKSVKELKKEVGLSRLYEFLQLELGFLFHFL